jgi:hypothetical protein
MQVSLDPGQIRDNCPGAVATSSDVSHTIAAAALSPHISPDGMSCPHTAGRPGWPKMRQAFDSFSCTQRTPAGLPCGMPGMGELMDGAMQQAPQPRRQFMPDCYGKSSN